MKNIALIICCILFSAFVYGQNYLPEQILTDTSKPMIIKMNYNFSYHTQNLPNSFINYFIYGGKISNDEKEHVGNGLKSSNTLGGEQSFGMRYVDFSSHPFKTKDWGYFINLEHQNHFGASFNKNLFNLTFNGNGPYTGEHLDLTGLEIMQTTYQKLGFGIMDSKSGSEVGLSIVKGQQFSYVNFTKGDFYTDDSTANITFDYGAEVARSNPDEKKFSAFNGVGIAVDMCWNFKLFRDTILPDLTKWQFRVMNAGFINWNESTQVYAKDSVINYTGYHVTSFFEPGQNLLGGASVKDTVAINYEEKKYSTLLPVDFRFGNIVDINRGRWIKPVFGFRYKLITGFKPMEYLGCIIRMNKKLNLQVVGSYGGFGGFRAGLKIQGKFGKNFNYILGTSSIDGLVSSSRFGKDAYIGCWFRF